MSLTKTFPIGHGICRCQKDCQLHGLSSVMRRLTTVISDGREVSIVLPRGKACLEESNFYVLSPLSERESGLIDRAIYAPDDKSLESALALCKAEVGKDARQALFWILFQLICPKESPRIDLHASYQDIFTNAYGNHIRLMQLVSACPGVPYVTFPRFAQMLVAANAWKCSKTMNLIIEAPKFSDSTTNSLIPCGDSYFTLAAANEWWIAILKHLGKKESVDACIFNSRSSTGYSVLMIAVLYNNIRFLEELKKIKAFDPNQVIKAKSLTELTGYTALHISVLHGRHDFMKALLAIESTKPDYTKSVLKITPLHLAIEKSDLTSVELLLAAGADPSLTYLYLNKKPLSAFDVAIRKMFLSDDALKVAVRLMQHAKEAKLKLNFNVRVSEGLTPLELANKRNLKDLAALMIELGASTTSSA